VKIWLAGRGNTVHKLAILTTLFILTIVGILIYTIITLQQHKSNSLMVDMAGRQRMLNQQHMKELLLLARGVPAGYTLTRNVLNETLEALINGGLAVVTIGKDEKARVPPAPTEAIKAKLAEQRELIRKLAMRADEFVHLPVDSTAYPSRLEELLELNSQLQRTADDAVKLYTAHSGKKIATMIQWEAAIGLLVAVLGLLLTRQVIQANRSLENEIAERKRTERELRISEELRINAFRQSDALKSALLSSTSHELRTPLTAIKTSVSSLLVNFGTMTLTLRKDFLEEIDQQIDYLNRLVDNLLDMSRIEAGMLVPRCEWYGLDDLVEGAIRRVGARLQTRPLHCQVDEDMPPVFVDGVEIQQVLVNLLDNAMKYSPDGSAIRLEAHHTGCDVEVRVTNTGQGIPAKDLERVFERFYRVRLKGPRMIHGTGLGLTICKGIVEAHGGRIWAESNTDTTIAFTLPQDQPQPSARLERLNAIRGNV
jgi:two-component system sensor histidine kinase KdpD